MIKILKRDNDLGIKSVEAIGKKIGRSRQQILLERDKNISGSEVELRLREQFPTHAEKVDLLLKRGYEENDAPLHVATDGSTTGSNKLQANVAEILSRVTNIETMLAGILQSTARNATAGNDKKANRNKKK